MQKLQRLIIIVWINSALLSACVTTKERVFGDDMPTMKAVHDNKFHQETSTIDKPLRPISQNQQTIKFRWLANPTLTLYVFEHITAAGHPVPGYSTFFKLYSDHPVATASEPQEWTQ